MGARAGIAFLTVACIAGSPAAASPWNRANDAIFTSTTANYYRSNTPTSAYSRIDSDTYFEYGVTDSWMLSGRASYGTSISDSAAGRITATGLNEAELSLQRQIQRAEHSATSIKISGIRSGVLSTDAQSGPPTSNYELEFRALYGRDILLSPLKIFAAAELGFRERFGGDAEQVRADAIIGLEPSRSWLFLIEAQTITSIRNESPGFADFDLYKGQVSIVWRKSRKFSVVLGGRKELSARNLHPGAAGFIGVWSEF